MLDGGVPVPPEFKGDKKSYTVPKPDNASDECGSIGVLYLSLGSTSFVAQDCSLLAHAVLVLGGLAGFF